MRNPVGKPLVWLRGEIKTPPFSMEARIEAGHLLRLAQLGWKISMPHSRPMPSIAARCHELRVKDGRSDWRIVYRIDADAVIIADVFAKTTRKTPNSVIAECKRRLKQYDEAK
jgi:phage-related protein